MNFGLELFATDMVDNMGCGHQWMDILVVMFGKSPEMLMSARLSGSVDRRVLVRRCGEGSISWRMLVRV